MGLHHRLLSLFLCLVSAICAWPQSQRDCKCGPNDSCWPSTSQWAQFNASIGGKLIADVPPAIVCYPGPEFHSQACAVVGLDLTNQSFVSDNPIALSYPTDSCPPVNLKADPCSIGYSNSAPCSTTNTTRPAGTCSIGDQPRYTVNATDARDVEATVKFARDHRIRLVIRNTGHDILRRSTGYGSLQIWIRYLRTGVSFQDQYIPSDQCSRSSWTGSAFTIGGGYVWTDVYTAAASRNVVVVGGGTPTVGCIGGWMQGGGHGPATHNFGLGADQVLEAVVVLASGQTVRASPCHHPELFFAIRGGGPSSYGVVISTTIKAHPDPSLISAQILAFAPRSSNDTSAFMSALNTVYSSYPNLSDSGFSGYGSWSLYSPTPLVPGVTSSTGFIHTIANFNKTIAQARALFAPTALKLAKDSSNGTRLYITTTYLQFPNYAAYYDTLSGIVGPVGSQSVALGSRLLTRNALTSDPSALAATLVTLAGKPGEATSNNIVFVGGGQVFRDGEIVDAEGEAESPPLSAVNPAWRRTYVHHIVARGWPANASAATIAAVHDDITNVKTAKLKALAPDTGCYMNEADRFDEDYLADFYGENAARLESVKRRYDPRSVFYCPTCVGSQRWVEDEVGVLCRVGNGGSGGGAEYGAGEEEVEYEDVSGAVEYFEEYEEYTEENYDNNDDDDDNDDDNIDGNDSEDGNSA